MDLRPRHPSDPQVAYQIPGGSSLILQTHYTTTGKGRVVDLVGFRLQRRRQDLAPLHPDPHNIAITPGDLMWRLSEKHTIPGKATLLGMFAHMHLRGRDMTFIAEYPSG